jgi:hypothetical protein
MDWLSVHLVKIDCFTKTITILRLNGEQIIFKVGGEMKVVSSCLISIMTAKKLTRKGCPVYLALVNELGKGKMELACIPIMREFPKVFLEELSGLPQLERLKCLSHLGRSQSDFYRKRY